MFAIIRYDEWQVNAYQVAVSFTCFLKCIRMKSHISSKIAYVKVTIVGVANTDSTEMAKRESDVNIVCPS